MSWLCYSCPDLPHPTDPSLLGGIGGQVATQILHGDVPYLPQMTQEGAVYPLVPAHTLADWAPFLWRPHSGCFSGLGWTRLPAPLDGTVAASLSHLFPWTISRWEKSRA